MRGKLGVHFQKDVHQTMHIFQTLVQPILLYCSDFWGVLKQPKNNPIENLYNMFLKQILGVQKQTNNLGVLLELGKVPIQFSAIKLATKNWECKHICLSILSRCRMQFSSR